MIISIYPVGPDFYRKRTILIRNGIFVELTTWNMAIQSHLLGTIEVRIFFEISDMYHIFQDKPADSWQNIHQVQTETVASGNSFHHHLGARCPTKCRHSFCRKFGCSEKSLSRFKHWLGNQLVHRLMDGWMDTHTQIFIYLFVCLSVCLSVCLFFVCFVLFVCLFVCVCWCVCIYICIHTHTYTYTPIKNGFP